MGKKPLDIGIEKQVVRSTSLMGTKDSSAPARVDVKDGKITRIRPLNYDGSTTAKSSTSGRSRHGGRRSAHR